MHAARFSPSPLIFCAGAGHAQRVPWTAFVHEAGSPRGPVRAVSRYLLVSPPAAGLETCHDDHPVTP
jgi:hypothetical protein